MDNFFQPLVEKRILLLRLAIGVIYIWFGLLKVFFVTPVDELLKDAYWFVPYTPFVFCLGIFETVIGLLFLLNIKLRLAVFMLWIQMCGVWFSVVLAPERFFNGNILLLTLTGEFMVKNLLLLTSSLFFLNSVKKK